MCEFICHNLGIEDEQQRPNGSRTSIESPYNEITTALIQMGVNISDHDLIFAKMIRQLKMYRNVRVALLKAKDCPDATSMIQSAVSQWLDEVNENQEFDPEQDGDDHDGSDDGRHRPWSYETHKIKPTRRTTIDMQTLLIYLRNRPMADRFHCIALLEDVECFSITALQDFIMICSDYRLECPIAFVFGLATSVEIFRNSLSKTALCLLRTHGFQLQHPMTILTSLIDTLLIGDHVFDRDGGFMLGWRAYKFLIDAVMLHHFSLEFFLKGLHYALMQHYRTNPMSFLGHSPRVVVPATTTATGKIAINDTSSTLHRVDILTTDHLEFLRQLPSFRKWTNSMTHDRQRIRDALLRDDDYFRSHLAQVVNYLRVYNRNYRLALDLFIRLQTSVEGTKKSKRILYLYGLEKHLFETAHFQQVMKRLG
jgi:origin recognition complex subunit 3